MSRRIPHDVPGRAEQDPGKRHSGGDSAEAPWLAGQWDLSLNKLVSYSVCESNRRKSHCRKSLLGNTRNLSDEVRKVRKIQRNREERGGWGARCVGNRE